MKLTTIILLDLAVLAWGATQELKFVFVIFRHGERTPSYNEMTYLRERDIKHLHHNNFYPHGTEALINKGKERAYRIGEYLRARYGKLLNTDYLPQEILVRSTDYARTKMSALLALAALYEPSQTDEQQWNSRLKWQPIPYEYLPYEMDDLLFFRNCQRFSKLREESYNDPNIQEIVHKYSDMFKELSQRTNKPIQTTLDSYNLDYLIRGLKHYNITVPEWLSKFEKEIKATVAVEYEAKFRTTEQIKLAAGPMMFEIFDTLDLIQNNDTALEMKMYLVAGSEITLMAWMLACKANRSMEASYFGATFSIEVSYVPDDEDYRVQLFYLAGSSESKPSELQIRNCVKYSKKKYCTIQAFKAITAKYRISYGEYLKECRSL